MTGIERRTATRRSGLRPTRALRSAAATTVQNSAISANSMTCTIDRRSLSLAEEPVRAALDQQAMASASVSATGSADRGSHGGLAEQPEQAERRQAHGDEKPGPPG